VADNAVDIKCMPIFSLFIFFVDNQAKMIDLV